MSRSRWLVATTVFLIGLNILWYVWRHWGLITVHADDKTIAEVIRSIERQGHVTIKTDLDPSTKVRMHVDEVPLAEALETLSTVTDSRWRLAYLFAPDAPTLQLAIGNFVSGQRPDGWRQIHYPLMGGGLEETAQPDPRDDVWKVKTPAEKKLQSYLDEAARNVSAAFLVPSSWNPDIASDPKSSEISEAASRLAKLSRSKEAELILLQKNGRRGPGEEGGPPLAEGADDFRPEFARNRGDRGDGPRADFRGGRNAMEERMQAEINKLPPDKRAAAQAEFDERKQFFTSLRELTPEERRAKIEEYMSQPGNADRMDQGMAQRDARMAPQQRIQRAQKYVDRKEAVKSGAAPAGKK